jgi:hypothetical protein
MQTVPVAPLMLRRGQSTVAFSADLLVLESLVCNERTDDPFSEGPLVHNHKIIIYSA